jgi:hypothetical protein
MPKEMSLEDEIRDALAATLDEPKIKEEPKEADENVVEKEEIGKEKDILEDDVKEKEPQPKEKAKPEKTDSKPSEKEKHFEQPPVSLSGHIKAKWNELPSDVRAEWKKREDDIQRMITSHDGELRIGRSIKEIAQPYEAIIRAEGGTVEGAFKDLLNTAYVLRTGSPQQKAQLLIQAAQQYGVDLQNYMGNQGQQNNPIAALQQEIYQLRQQADPQKIKNQLQEDFERDKVQNEIKAFSSNPENVHFEAVKSTMGSLLASGRAKDLKDAYEMAIWSDPSIRAELLNAQKAQEAEKKKAEMAAKKKASASVAGSHGVSAPSSNAPKQSIEDQLRSAMRESTGLI